MPVDANDDVKSALKSMSETITFDEHMTPAQVGREVEKVAKLMNFLVGKMLLAAAFQSAGAAHPLAQQLIQCAAAAGSVAAAMTPQNQIQLAGQIPPMPGMGRA